tara:strand:+ start:736 stop:1140 length:405 start_codon:yes stop_codon:yes gene_type:complete
MLSERKLTDRELKKRDEIVTAIKRDRKEENLTDEEVYAIATAQAKKTNEGIMDPYERLVAIMEAMKALPDKRSEDEILQDRVNMMAKQVGFDPNTESMMRVASQGKPGSIAKRLANQIVVGKVKQALRKKGVKS